MEHRFKLQGGYAFNELYRRETAVAATSDVPGVYALAAKSATDGEAVFLCNTIKEAREIDLAIAGAAGSRFSVRRVDDGHRKLSPDGFYMVGGKIRLPPSSITLLEKDLGFDRERLTGTRSAATDIRKGGDVFCAGLIRRRRKGMDQWR